MAFLSDLMTVSSFGLIGDLGDDEPEAPDFIRATEREQEAIDAQASRISQISELAQQNIDFTNEQFNEFMDKLLDEEFQLSQRRDIAVERQDDLFNRFITFADEDSARFRDLFREGTTKLKTEQELQATLFESIGLSPTKDAGGQITGFTDIDDRAQEKAVKGKALTGLESALGGGREGLKTGTRADLDKRDLEFRENMRRAGLQPGDTGFEIAKREHELSNQSIIDSEVAGNISQFGNLFLGLDTQEQVRQAAKISGARTIAGITSPTLASLFGNIRDPGAVATAGAANLIEDPLALQQFINQTIRAPFTGTALSGQLTDQQRVIADLEARFGDIFTQERAREQGFNINKFNIEEATRRDEFGFSDIFGAVAGGFGGAIAGPVGTAVGTRIGSNLFGDDEPARKIKLRQDPDLPF